MLDLDVEYWTPALVLYTDNSSMNLVARPLSKGFSWASVIPRIYWRSPPTRTLLAH